MAAWQADNERPRPLPVLQRSVFLLSVISFSHAYFSFTSEPLLTDVSFVCAGGERLCVVGPNGAGKTTLLKAALDLIPRLTGEVRYFGERLGSVSAGSVDSISFLLDGGTTIFWGGAEQSAEKASVIEVLLARGGDYTTYDVSAPSRPAAS